MSQVSLLHLDGTNGSTSFVDISGKTLTAHGNAQLSTAQKKFGASSGYFDGDADYVLGGDYYTDFNFYASNGNWTIDYWFFTTSVSAGTKTHLQFYNGWLTNGGLHIYQSGTALHVDNGNSASGLSYGTLSANTWYHHAVVNSGGTILCFLNGDFVDSEAAQNYSNTGSRMQIGCFATAYSNNFPGYIDEIHVDKGVAIWTSAFTPPTHPWGWKSSGGVCSLSSGFGVM